MTSWVSVPVRSQVLHRLTLANRFHAFACSRCTSSLLKWQAVMNHLSTKATATRKVLKLRSTLRCGVVYKCMLTFAGQIRRDALPKFESEINERLFGIKRPEVKAVSQELCNLLTKCGIPAAAIPTFLKEEILTISDAKFAFSQNLQAAALNITIMQWAKLARELASVIE